MGYIIEHLWFVLLAIGIILVTLLVTQLYSSKRPTATFICRKILHIVSVGVCTLVLADSKGDQGIMVVFLIATVLLILEVNAKRLNISDGNSYGIALFPLAYALLYLFQVDYRAICLGGLVLTFSDPMAGLIGKYFANYNIVPFKEVKSYIGAVTFFGVTILVLFLQPWYDHDFYHFLIIAFISMLAELFSWRGSDNLTIVLTVGLLSHYLLAPL